MAALICHASSSSLPACAAAEEWGDLSDEEQFIQEDDSVLALIEHSEADSEDVLDALIQAELAKFQQQQAEKYAALLSEGQAVLPLPSPAPHQQQLRAQRKQQEALVDAATFEEQERLEYVPSADAEQLMRQHSSSMPCSADSPEHHQEQQEQPTGPDQLRSEPASTTSVHAEASPAVLADGPCPAVTEPNAAEAAFLQPTEGITGVASGSAACIHEAQGDVLDMPPAECSPSGLQPQGSKGQLDGPADTSEQQLQDTAAADCAAASTCTDPAAAAHSTTDCAALLATEPSTSAPTASDACSTCAEPAVADLGVEQHTDPMQQQSVGPAQMEYVLHELSKLQLQQAAELSNAQEQPGADADADGGACTAHDSMLLLQPLLEPFDSAVECPELPGEHSECLQEQKVLQEQLQLQQGFLEQQAEPSQQAQHLEQQQQQDEKEEGQQQQQDAVGAEQEGKACEPDPDVLSQRTSESTCAQPAAEEAPADAALAASSEAAAAAAAAGSLAEDAAAGCSSAGPEAEGSEDAEGFIYQDEDQAYSPGNPASPTPAPAPAADPASWQAAAARTSEGASAAAAAAFAAMSIAAAGAGELSPWEACTEDNVCSSTQHGSASGSCRQSQDSSSRLSPRLRQQSPRQQQERQQQQQQQQRSPRPPQPPRQPSPQHQRVQQHQLPGQGRAFNRPSSAPVWGSRPHVTLTGPVAAQLALHQSGHAAASAASALPNRMPVVAESSREGPCSSRGLPRRQPAPYQPIPSSPMQYYQGAAATSEWTANMHHQQHYDEEQYQQVMLARMQQLQQPPSRPVSADPWRRSRSQPRVQHAAVYDQQQQQQRQLSQQRQSSRRSGPAWDDSPMPLHIPRWVTIAQAVQLPSTTVAANASYCGWGNSSLGSSSILGGSPTTRVAWVPESIRADAGGRPQTAGPVMVDNSNHSRAWESAQQLLHDRSGCLTARSACSSPSRMRSAMLPIPPVTPSGAAAYRYDPMAVDGFSGLSGFDAGPYAAAQPSRSVSPSGAGCCGKGGATPVGVYLLDVLQQIRQANSCSRQLGLSTQYKLAEGSSKKDKWQLEQIEVELWTPASSHQPQGQEQYYQQWAGVDAGPAGEGQWQLRKVLSLPQFKAHLNRLKGSTPVGGMGPVGGAAVQHVRSSISPYAAFPAAGGAAAAVRLGSAAAQCGGLLSQRALSPDRYRVRPPDNATSQVSAGSGVNAAAGGRRASSTSRGSRMNRTGSASRCQLLVLSPRGSGSGEQVQRLVRPASAPRGYIASRRSPRRR